MLFRAELIHYYESLDIPYFRKLLYNDSLYICFYRDSDLMKNWIEKSQKLEGTKLYSWFIEIVEKENIKFDENIEAWYKLISGNENQETSDDDLWF